MWDCVPTPCRISGNHRVYLIRLRDTSGKNISPLRMASHRHCCGARGGGDGNGHHLCGNPTCRHDFLRNKSAPLRHALVDRCARRARDARDSSCCHSTSLQRGLSGELRSETFSDNVRCKRIMSRRHVRRAGPSPRPQSFRILGRSSLNLCSFMVADAGPRIILHRECRCGCVIAGAIQATMFRADATGLFEPFPQLLSRTV